MNDTQKKALITVLVIVLAVALLYGLRWFVEKFPPAEKQQVEQQAAQVVSSVPTTQDQSASQIKVSAGSAGSAYQKALDTYPFRIQFKDCRGIGEPPAVGGSLVLKQGTKLMLDNRDKVAHTIAFKGVSVKVGPENFAIVTANTLGIYNVTCDGGGAASLNVEK